MKKILTLVACLSLAATLAVGGSIAYLQDTDQTVNVMTLGNVDIEQIEQERDGEGNLVDFTQSKPVYPAVYEGTSIPYAAADKWIVANDEAWKVVEDNDNVVDKFVSVKNTGKSDAFVRTIIAFEVGKDAVNDPYMHLVCNTNNVKDKTTWTLEWIDGTVEISGNYYTLGVFTYNDKLAAGETTIPSVKQVYLDKTATNEVCEAYGDTFEILVVTQAVQTAGFSDGATALNTAFGVVSATSHPWIDMDDPNNENDQDPDGMQIPVVVNNLDELNTALATGGSIILNDDIEITETINITQPTKLNLNGKKMTVSVLEAKADTEITGGEIIHGKSTYPALSVSNGTLTLNDMSITCKEPCNIVTSGSAEAAEYAALEIWEGGNCVLNNCDIVAQSEKVRYSNSIFGIGIHGGALTMNGGSITVINAGSTKEKFNYEGAIFAGSAGEKTVNLNYVDININDTKGKLLFAWGGKTTVNTTDAQDSWTADKIDARNGGTYEINYVK